MSTCTGNTCCLFWHFVVLFQQVISNRGSIAKKPVAKKSDKYGGTELFSRLAICHPAGKLTGFAPESLATPINAGFGEEFTE